MSNAELPRSVDPHRMAEAGAELEGNIPLAKLERFRDGVFAIPEGGFCRVHLVFSRDGERRRIVRGHLEAEVELECQRCMGAMRTTLTSDFSLGMVTSDEKARQLPSELEPFIIEDERAELWTMVEDELLLALPAYPLHDREECPASEDLKALESDADDGSESQTGDGERRDNPFKVLEGLKTTKH